MLARTAAALLMLVFGRLVFGADDPYAPSTYITINNVYIDQYGRLVLQDQRTAATTLPGYEGYLEISINGPSTAGIAVIASTINRGSQCQSGSNSFGALSESPSGNTQTFGTIYDAAQQKVVPTTNITVTTPLYLSIWYNNQYSYFCYSDGGHYLGQPASPTQPFYVTSSPGNLANGSYKQLDFSSSFPSIYGDRIYYMPVSSIPNTNGSTLFSWTFAGERYDPDGSQWTPVTLYEGCDSNFQNSISGNPPGVRNCAGSTALFRTAEIRLADSNRCGGCGIWAETWQSATPVVLSGNLIFSMSNPYGFDLYGTTTQPYPGQVFEDAQGAVQSGELYFDIEFKTSQPPPVTFGPPSATNPSGFTNEPINTATGDYYTSHTDLAVPGKGLAFTFNRFYNSLDSYSGPLGFGWTHSFNVFLAVTAASVSVKQADGSQVTFTSTGGGNYTPATPGLFDTLAQNNGGSFTLTRKNQTRLNFSPAGKLTSIIDRNGNAQTLNYDGSGYLIAIVDSAARVFLITNDSFGRITALADPIGRTWRYAYDGNGNLQSIMDAAGGVTQYTYDASHRMLSAIDARGVTYLQNVYDGLGRVISQTNARSFTTTLAYNTPSSGITSFTDPLGNITQHVYDSGLRLTGVIDAKGGTTSYAYDGNNDRTSVTNQNGKTTTFAYDSNGNATAITDPLGNLTKLTYDSRNNVLSATDPKGNTTAFNYDGNSNLVSSKDALGNTATFIYNTSGLLTSKTDARGNMTAFSFDLFGNLTVITDALGNKTSLGYDGIGRIISVTDPKSHTGTSSYDALSRIVKVTDPLGDQTQLAYDPVGNLVKLTDANGHATTYAYDGTNNLSTVTGAASNVTRYAYDGNNNRIGFTNAKGNTTLYGFDQINHLNEITDALSFVTAYNYDAVGNVISTTDANGKTNQFSFDPLNRLTNIAYADGTAVAYSYDANGNRMTMTDPHGTTTYSYDALNRLTSTVSKGGTVRYAYDTAGNRSSLTYPDGKLVTYSYDRLNRLASATDWLGKATNYTYDPTSNLIQTQYPNRAGITFGYDAANRLTEVVNAALGLPLLRLDYTLDKVGNRTSLNVDGVSTTFTYDQLNELLSAQLGPLKTTWTYDQVGNRVKEVAPTGTTLYAYDAADRLVNAGVATFVFDRNGNLISKTSHNVTTNYTYDPANRLVNATGPEVNSSFSYDGDGNRMGQATRLGSYSYVNDLNTSLPVVLSEQGPDGAITYAYGLGLIEEAGTAFDYFYHFDGLGSVIALTNSAGIPVAAYAYDAWGNALLTVPDSAGTRNKFRFTGQALDSGTGLYYQRARYYDPTIGRFTRADAFSGFTRFPQSLNKYVYANANPMRFSDPAGLTPQDAAESTFTPLALNFPLPNTVLNPQFTPPSGGGGSSVPCNALSDCLDFAFSGIGTIVSGDLAGQVLSFDAFSAEANRDSGNWPALVIDVLNLGLGVCPTAYCKLAAGAEFVIDTAYKSDVELPTNGSTPSVNTPLAPIRIK